MFTKVKKEKVVKFITKAGYEILPNKKTIRLKGNPNRLNTIHFEIKELRNNDEVSEYDLSSIIQKPTKLSGWKLNSEWRIK